MQLDNQFTNRVREALPTYPTLGPVYKRLKDQKDKEEREVVEWEETDFVLRADDLLYSISDNLDRLCLPVSMQKELCEMVHDHDTHAGIEAAYGKARGTVFTPRLKETLSKYIKSCPAC